MAPSQTEIESLIIELAEKSFKTFCDDISGMFGTDMECVPQEVTPETVNGLQTRFKDLEVVYSVKAEGALDGTFQLVFDKKGLFLLAGVVAMHPEQIILEDVESGTLEKAEKASNILKEVGTALAGSWDRVFRKGLDGHNRFVQTDTFIGNPWDKSEEKIGLDSDEELVFVPYEMTIGPYPAFNCGAIFPKAFFAGTPNSGTEQVASAEEIAQEKAEEIAQEEVEQKTQGETEEIAQEETENRDPNLSEPAEEIQDKAQEEAEEIAQEKTVEATESEESAAADDQAQPADEETVPTEESATKQETEPVAEQKPNDIEEEATTPAETEKRQERPISEAIKQMTQSFADSLDESIPSTMDAKPAINKDALFAVCAKDIMQKDVVWANPDDSVKQALAKIQQHNTGYMMVSKGQELEGIVSMSDLTGALSPYLRTIFAKWRRPMDDATFRIRVKWIMSKPTCTISPDTSLAAIMENMCQADKKCLPVVDDQGTVQGIVTVFDILSVLLKHSHTK